MVQRSAFVKDASLLAACVAACFIPTPLLSVPAALILLVYLPGVFAIRCCRLAEDSSGRHWLGIPMSLVVMGLVLSIVWRWSNDRSVLLATVIAVNGVLLIAAHLLTHTPQRPLSMFDNNLQRGLFIALILWVGLCVFLCYHLPPYFGIIHPIGDYVKHHAICLSLDRSPLPLHNMFFATQSEKPCYYYEQFYLFPATLRILADRTASIATVFGLMAGVVASTFVAMVYLIARHMFGSVRNALLAAVCVSIVGGWDIIPSIIYWVVIGKLTVVLDVWCPVAWRIHNLSNNYYWCPQHNAAVLMFLWSCHLLQINKNRRWWIILAPLVATSIFGTSVHQAMTVFVAAGIFVLIEWRRLPAQGGITKAQFLSAVALIGVFGLVLMMPRLLQYQEMNARYDGGLTMRWERFPLAVFGRLLPPGPLANWLDAPWLLPLDFGLGALAVVLISRSAWRGLWRDDGTRLLFIAGVLGLLTMWLIRSDVNRYDYGFRLASTFTMIAAALCAGFLLQPENMRCWARPIHRPLLCLGILLGLPIGLYEAPLMAVRAMILPRAEQADAGACRFIRQQTPCDAVVQRLPVKSAELVQLTGRRTGVCLPSDSHVNIFRPPDADPLEQGYADITKAFDQTPSQDAHAMLQRWGVTYVLIGSVEFRECETWPQFDDDTWFKKVYDDGKARVYHLVESNPPAVKSSLDTNTLRDQR